LRRTSFPNQSAAALLILGYLVHTLGLLVEMMLEGRPPVTNVYASIIFAGWIVMSVAGAVERWRRNSGGMVTAALAGVTTLAAAHVLAPGDVAEIARAATDIGLWLTVFLVVVASVTAKSYSAKHAGEMDDNKARCAVRRPSVWYSLARRLS
jgi:ABC-type transport system involved in cytochrome c biogenesis permease subunit